jgi:hypothetical protein
MLIMVLMGSSIVFANPVAMDVNAQPKYMVGSTFVASGSANDGIDHTQELDEVSSLAPGVKRGPVRRIRRE